jgi:hypothetical protein
VKQLSFIRRGKRAVAATLSVGLIVAALATLLLTSGASALTGTAGPATVTVTPTTNLTDGQAVAVSATFAAGSVSEMRVHLCAHNAGISNTADFDLDGPFCSPNKVSPAADAEKFVAVAPSDTSTSISGGFHVGIGTGAPWTDFLSNTHTLQCDSTHQCDIVVQFQITGAQSWFTAPLTFQAPPTNPGAPTGVSALAGDAQCTVSWAAPANTGNSTIDQYVVTTTGTGAPGPITVPGTTTSTVVSPLTNGNSYTFTVHAHTAAGFTGPESTASSPCSPAALSRFIHPHLDVTRPTGDLVLTQACAGSDPYPDDLSTVQYPTGDVDPALSACTVHMGNAKLIKTGPGAGQYFEASAPTMNPVTIVDTRDTDPGWNVNGSVSSFTTPILAGGAPNTFSGNDLGWTPSNPTVTPPFDGPDGHYEQHAAAGGAVPPATGGSLGSPKPLAIGAARGTFSGQPGGGLGIAQLNAALKVWIPIFAQHGTYTAVLTITAI